MANAILNFHFDYLHSSLNQVLVNRLQIWANPPPTCGVPLKVVPFKLSPVQRWQLSALLNSRTKIPFANCSWVPVCHQAIAFPLRAPRPPSPTHSSTQQGTHSSTQERLRDFTWNSEVAWFSRWNCVWKIKFLFLFDQVALHCIDI